MKQVDVGRVTQSLERMLGCSLDEFQKTLQLWACSNRSFRAAVWRPLFGWRKIPYVNPRTGKSMAEHFGLPEFPRDILTDDMRRIISHSLTGGSGKPPHRNWFAASKGHHSERDLRILVVFGMMRIGAPYRDGNYYHVTPRGARCAGLTLPKEC